MATAVWILLLIGWLLGLVVFYVAAHDEPAIVRWREWHHGYLGDALVLWALFHGASWWLVLGLVGAWFRWDDSYEHVVQAERRDAAFQSPLHRLFATYLWPQPFWRWLTRLLDRAFGKRTP